MANTRVRLNFRAAYWWSVLLIFLVSERNIFARLPRRVRFARRVFFTLSFAPFTLVASLVLGAVLTVVADTLFLLLIRPLVVRWHSPRVDDSRGSFHLAANEWAIDSTPARRAEGRRWVPGTLVRTNLQLWFFPQAHEDEAWSCPIGALTDVRLEAAPRVAWGLVRDWPDRFTAHSLVDERSLVFAVPEPLCVLSWFKPPRPLAAAGPSFP